RAVNDPRSLSNQPATAAEPGNLAPRTYSPGATAPAPGGAEAPSGTAYPPGPGLEAARQRALSTPSGSPPGSDAAESNNSVIPPSAPGTGGERSRTAEPGRNPDIEATTPGVPGSAEIGREGPGD